MDNKIFNAALVAFGLSAFSIGWFSAKLNTEYNAIEAAELRGEISALNDQRLVYERALEEKQLLVVEYGARRADIANELREYRRRVEQLTNSNSSLTARLQALQQRSIHDGQD